MSTTSKFQPISAKSGETNISRRTLLGAAAATAIGHTLTAQAAVDVGTILIGQSAVFSGMSSALGLEMKQGIDAAFKQTNDAGGVLGRKLTLVSLDDGYEPDRAKANTTQLIDKQCVALLGYVGTPTTVACVPLIDAAKTPLIGPFTGAGSLRDPVHQYVFNVRASYADEVVSILKHITALKGKNSLIGIVYQDDGYGTAVKDALEAGLRKLDMKPVATATIKRNSSEVDTAVAIMLEAKVQSILVASTYMPTALLMQKIRAGGLAPQFASVSFLGTSAIIDNFPTASRGLAIAQVMPYPGGGALPVVYQFQTAMKAIDERKFTYGAIEGYIAARVLIEGLKASGPTINRATLTKALSTLNTDIGGFKVAFSDRSHQGSKFAELTAISADGGIVH